MRFDTNPAAIARRARAVLGAAALALLLHAPAWAPAWAQASAPDAAPDAGPAPQDEPAEPPPAIAALRGGASASIVAVVNGDIISQADVDNRRRLFALSSGLGVSPQVLDRLTPQVTRQLIDEKLRLQEIQRRHIVVPDQEIAHAIQEVEGRNGLQPGMLRRRLEASGVELRTLIDQLRVQLGWTRVLRQQLGTQTQITDADIAEQTRLLKEQVGQPEYRVSEIFVPIETPKAAADAQKFADTVIGQLREGAPFPVAAAQFSQSQTALQGGDLGWVQASQLDPAQVRVLDAMPPGAISNPIRVPGGLSIVTLRAKREIGRDVSTVLSVRQAFLQFTSPLDPQAPTEQQKQALEQARKLSATAHECEAIEAANKQFGSGRPSDPGEVSLDNMAPAMRGVLEKLQPGHPSQPLVAQDGIAVVMVCGRDTKTASLPTRNELQERILNERVELASRQLLRDLQRRAIIEQRA